MGGGRGNFLQVCFFVGRDAEARKAAGSSHRQQNALTRVGALLDCEGRNDAGVSCRDTTSGNAAWSGSHERI